MANIKTNTTTIQSILETINALPEAGNGNGVDVSGVTAVPADVLAPKVFVDADGNEKTGTLTTEELTDIEPTTEEQTFTPNSGKLYSKVVINAIDPSYIIPKYTQEENTWTPTTEEQTIPAGTYCSGTQTIGAIPTDYIKPTGEKSITSNGTYNVTNYASANVNVPIPSGYVKPTSTQTAKTWTPTTSEQSIAAGTYCSGKQTISAIPSSYVQPNYTSAGGTYTLDPGESVSYNAKTYLTSALSVTAAASSGGSGYIGNTISGTCSSTTSINITCDTNNMIGFILNFYYSSPPNSTVERVSSIFSNRNTNSCFWTAVWINDSDDAMTELFEDGLAVSYYSGYINLVGGSSVSSVYDDQTVGSTFPSGEDYVFIPIYSA